MALKNAPVSNVTETSTVEDNTAVEKKPRTPRPKVTLTPWGSRDAEGHLVTKLTTGSAPTDWDPKKNEPLRRADFDSSANYIGFRAEQFEKRAAQLRKMEADERSGVGKQTKGKQKRLLSLKEKYEALRKELEAAGVDVDQALTVKA